MTEILAGRRDQFQVVNSHLEELLPEHPPQSAVPCQSWGDGEGPRSTARSIRSREAEHAQRGGVKYSIMLPSDT